MEDFVRRNFRCGFLVLSGFAAETVCAHPKGGKDDKGGKGESGEPTQDEIISDIIDQEEESDDEASQEQPSDEPTPENGNRYAKGQPLHDQATATIANIISSDSGVPAENYIKYAGKLAETLGKLNPQALARVLGENSGKLP